MPKEIESLEKNSPRRIDFYKEVLDALRNNVIPYGIMGGRALDFYTQGGRKPTADLDIGIPPREKKRALEAASGPGRRTELKHDWLDQVWTYDPNNPAREEFSIDVINGHSTGLVEVQDWWIDHGVEGSYLGSEYHFVAPEAIAITKALLMFTRAHDIPDAIQVIYNSNRIRPFDWQLLIDNLGPERRDWRLAYSLAVLTEILYGPESVKVKALPQEVKDQLHSWFAPNQIPGPVRGNYFAWEVAPEAGSRDEDRWRDKSTAITSKPGEAVSKVLDDLNNWSNWDGGHSRLVEAARKIVGQEGRFDWNALIASLGDNWRMALVAMLSTEILFGETGSAIIPPDVRISLSERFRTSTPGEEQGTKLFPNRSWGTI